MKYGWQIQTTEEGQVPRLWNVAEVDPDVAGALARDEAAKAASRPIVIVVIAPILEERAKALALFGGEVREIKK